MTITPITGPMTPQVTIPVTPVRPVIPVVTASTPSLEIGAGQISAQVLAQTAQGAAVQQGGLAPLMADLVQAAGNPGLPPNVRSAAAQVLAQASPTSAGVTPGDLARALSSSGLFLEANLAASPQTSPIGQDMKAGLLVLNQALAAWLAGAPKARQIANPARTPPPPYRAGSTRAQPSAMPSLPTDAAPSAVGQRLMAETKAAIARQELLQIASLPAAPGEALEAQVTRWMFEMPFTTPQGASVAQFEISRDGRGGAAAAPAWRVAFSLDIEPLGPIHARVALIGDQAVVSLWAERDEGLIRLRQDQQRLGAALARVSFRSEIVVHSGAPPNADPDAGQLVDQIS